MQSPKASTDFALDALGGKWKTAILSLLAAGARRTHELHRRLPFARARTVLRALRELERDRLVTRAVHPSVPPRVEYTITDTGRAALPVIEVLSRWGLDLARASYAAEPDVRVEERPLDQSR